NIHSPTSGDWGSGGFRCAASGARHHGIRSAQGGSASGPSGRSRAGMRRAHPRDRCRPEIA
ncbi:hypothetical protein, partial [Dysosmobacter sp.]|uniref:hypothetical protein n=1 Tax=Dysosmobacter sp. TaxID=2591382 RepID=UPI003AB2D54F